MSDKEEQQLVINTKPLNGDPPTDSILYKVNLQKIKDNNTGFTREIIRHVNDQLKSLKEHGGDFVHTDLDGKEKRDTGILPIERYDNGAPKTDIEVKLTAYQVAEHAKVNHVIGLVTVGSLLKSTDYEEAKPFLYPNFGHAQFMFNQHFPQRATLLDYLDKYPKEWNQVNKIVCFCMGNLLPRDETNQDELIDCARAFGQHWLARFVRNTLSEIRGKPESELKIYAQDIRYSDIDRRFLHDEYQIEVLDGLGGYLELDEHSFAICLHGYPIGQAFRQVMTQVSAPVGGPAAMLCAPVRNDGMFKDWVHEPDLVDPDSPFLVDYAKRCHVEVLSDFTEEEIPELLGDSRLYLKKLVSPKDL